MLAPEERCFSKDCMFLVVCAQFSEPKWTSIEVLDSIYAGDQQHCARQYRGTSFGEVEMTCLEMKDILEKFLSDLIANSIKKIQEWHHVLVSYVDICIYTYIQYIHIYAHICSNCFD